MQEFKNGRACQHSTCQEDNVAFPLQIKFNKPQILKFFQKYIVYGYNSHKSAKPRDKEYAFFSSSYGLIVEIFLPQLPKIPSSLTLVLWEIRQYRMALRIRVMFKSGNINLFGGCSMCTHQWKYKLVQPLWRTVWQCARIKLYHNFQIYSMKQLVTA